MSEVGGAVAVEDGERRRQRTLEEALEVQSLRRIISAYLNYPEAAEEDVRRYERSFRKLSPAHKALLPHYPMKFQKLRSCIATNSYFIFNMLQAFEPPLDMSQDMDCCDDLHHEHASGHHCLSEQRNSCCSPAPGSGANYCSRPEEACHGEGSHMHKMSTGEPISEETTIGGSHDCPVDNGRSGVNDGATLQQEPDAPESNGDANAPNDWLDPSIQLHVPLVDVDKVRCIIRNIVRDWAAEGQKERDECYKPILEELDSQFPHRSKERAPACLVPGAGLGRLALEISRLVLKLLGTGQYILGSIVTVIHFQIAINFVLCQYQIFILRVQGLLKDFLCAVATLSKSIVMQVKKGSREILPCWNNPKIIFLAMRAGYWDAVVTCFFIDTAHNIVEYIEIISKILKDGGVWINLGPLLYHFADMYGQEDEMSVELSLEDVKRIAIHYGFEFEKEKTIETTYTTNPRSMMQNHYSAAFWTARKRLKATTDERQPTIP
ncbi:unnamed protein product [Linum tenue]|uniref:carnosine N-methyltransferase n=1 Tax=Linum tenue TaxID=586396 RepID=A0AAV0M0F1_9ROSI|nr:unnamed protein product [Linum tenue]